MRKRFLSASSLMVVVLCAGAVFGQEIPEAKEALSRYVTAALASEGETVVSYISSPTFKAWDAVMQLARTADKSTMERQDLHKQFTVLWIRKRFSAAELRQMTGKRYVSLSYTKGYNSKKPLQMLKNIIDTHPWQMRRVSDDVSLFYQVDGKWKRAAGLRMISENGQWKIDGADQFALVAAKLASEWKASSMSREEFLREFFRKAVGEYPEDSLWEPRP
ncbi:MAG: hypothetical protein JXO72_01435 [Vicinamibacteria bacterium]|nr:hypothetical protein [Vicinamibacteria bacterium]